MYRFLLRPRWIAFTAVVVDGDRRDGQPRVLAAAPPRRAQGVQRRRGGADRPAAGSTSTSSCHPTPRSATTSSPTSSGDRSRRPAVPHRRGAPCRQPLAGRSRRRQRRDPVAARRRADRCSSPAGSCPSTPRRRRRRPATSTSSGACAAPRSAAPARCPIPATGDLTEAQRIDIPRLAAQLPGDVVPMYVELTASDPPPRAIFPSRSPHRRSARARTCRTPCSGSSSRRSSRSAGSWPCGGAVRVRP